MLQPDLDALRNYYFMLEDGTDWPTATKSDALVVRYKARIASMSQKLQDDLVLLMDDVQDNV